MDMKYLLLLALIIYDGVLSSPVLKEGVPFLQELEPEEEKIREKRKIDLLQHLESSGIGVKKSLPSDSDAGEGSKEPEVPTAVETEEVAKQEEGTRAKKQAPDSIGTGGKAPCGRIRPAIGPISRVVMQDRSPPDNPKLERYPALQSRTFDSILPVSSLASAVTYAVPTTTTYAADTTLAHTLPAIAAPAVPVAPIAHIEPLSLNLLSHSIPMPSLHPMHAMLAHHPLMNLNLQRVELPKLPEIIYAPAEVKQPAYEVKPVVATRPVAAAPYVYPSRYGAVNSGYDGPMICHPYDEKMSQQVIQIRPEVHVIESGSKTLNSSVEEFKSQVDHGEDDQKTREDLRQVNEIREEINQLNRAAQRIMDQQEKLAEMQQRHLWKAEDRGIYGPYNGMRMYMVPPINSRANALSYPTSMEDMEFFMNMLKAGKKIGALSETFQPALVSALDATRLVLAGEQNGQGQSSKGVKQETTTGQSGGGSSNIK